MTDGERKTIIVVPEDLSQGSLPTHGELLGLHLGDPVSGYVYNADHCDQNDTIPPCNGIFVSRDGIVIGCTFNNPLCQR